MPRLGLALSAASGAITRTPPPAPSGIPVASIVVVASGAGVPIGTYNKKAENDYIGNVLASVFYAGTGVIYNKSPDTYPNYNPAFFLAPNATITDGSDTFINNDSGDWVAAFLFNDDGVQYSVYASKPSTNPNLIPTTGWTPSVTITTA